ncbi:MAG: plasmid related protein [Saprospiraceae bacterium]|nr:plasmid related protein [Saprospiraceae bacterium]
MHVVSINHSLLLSVPPSSHLQGDWGDCCEQDQDSNETALQGGGRLFSVYHIPAGLFALESKIWIITESDRSYTTVLFPSEY